MKLSKKFNRIYGKLGFDNYPLIEAINPQVMNLTRKLKITNFSRQLLVAFFAQHLTNNRSLQDGALQIGVVGGNLQEPELAALSTLGYEFEVSVLGIENDSDFQVDLNMSNFVVPRKFDLILCSQVLEHVWDIHHSFLNLCKLLENDGLLWLSCPASNRFHGSPNYFSAGYSDEFLRSQISKVNLEVLASGSFGTHRNYIATHALDVWLSTRGHRCPFLYAFESKPVLVRLALSARFFFRISYLGFLSPRVTGNPRFTTESWILARNTH